MNQRALNAAESNARTAGLDNVRFSLADGADPALRFAAIWSNPDPHRQGRPARPPPRLAPRLTPGGLAHLVVQKHLGSDSLQRWLGGQGYPTERIASRSAYRVLRVAPRTEGPTR